MEVSTENVTTSGASGSCVKGIPFAASGGSSSSSGRNSSTAIPQKDHKLSYRKKGVSKPAEQCQSLPTSISLVSSKALLKSSPQMTEADMSESPSDSDSTSVRKRSRQDSVSTCNGGGEPRYRHSKTLLKDSTRLDRTVFHYTSAVTAQLPDKRKKCRSCKKKTATYCVVCKIPLCSKNTEVENCFWRYHVLEDFELPANAATSESSSAPIGAVVEMISQDSAHEMTINPSSELTVQVDEDPHSHQHQHGHEHIHTHAVASGTSSRDSDAITFDHSHAHEHEHEHEHEHCP